MVADAHLHTNPVVGRGARAIAKKFKSEGGWFAALVSLPPQHYGLAGGTLDDYRKVVELMVREAREAREQGLEVAVLAGFHPSEVDRYARMGMRADEVYRLAVEVLEMIAGYAREGLVQGIGEVGRQHYGTSPERLTVAELVTARALELARDHGLLVHLHMEQAGWATASWAATMARLAGTPQRLVAVHHAYAETAKWCNSLGLFHSIPVKLDLGKAVPRPPSRSMIESDYIDGEQSSNPPPWEIGRRLEELVREGGIGEEDAMKLAVDNVAKFYGVRPP
ncbi:MAG: TatD family hydrolase [Desulfurococcaceae archaeon]